VWRRGSVADTLFIASVDVFAMSDSRLLHSIEREIQIEVPKEVLIEAALRTDVDATRTEIHNTIHDHVERRIEFVTHNGESAVDAILSQSQ
jgi:hypothetical protein